MKKIGIVVKPDHPQAKKVVRDLMSWIEQKGKEVVLEADTASVVGQSSRYTRSQLPSLVDMIIVLGGDGTLLGVARVIGECPVPLLGVNLGGLGFLTEIPLEELYPSLGKIFQEQFVINERLMLSAFVQRGGTIQAQSHVLNDVVIGKGTLPRMVRLSVHIDDQNVISLRGDGLIIASPTGSTAYSLSSGGPILYPNLEAMLLTPISPHTLTNRPIVIPANSVVEVTVLTKEEGAVVNFDGQAGCSVTEGDAVVVRGSTHKIRLIQSPAKNYYEVLRKKLKWGEV